MAAAGEGNIAIGRAVGLSAEDAHLWRNRWCEGEATLAEAALDDLEEVMEQRPDAPRPLRADGGSKPTKKPLPSGARHGLWSKPERLPEEHTGRWSRRPIGAARSASRASPLRPRRILAAGVHAGALRRAGDRA